MTEPQDAPAGPVLREDEVRRRLTQALRMHGRGYSAAAVLREQGAANLVDSLVPVVAALVSAAEQRGAERERERKAAEDKNWNNAVDWLLNYEGDPDVQDPFWAIAEGTITREEVGRLSAEAVRARRHKNPDSDAFGEYPDASEDLP